MFTIDFSLNCCKYSVRILRLSEYNSFKSEKVQCAIIPGVTKKDGADKYLQKYISDQKIKTYAFIMV